MDRGSIRAFRPYDKSNRASAKRLAILRRAEARWKGNQCVVGGRGARARKMAREDRTGNDLILSRGPWEREGARGAPTQWKGKTSFCRAACAGRDEKSCSSELATTGNRGDRRHPGLVSSWKLWSLGRMPFLVKQETKTPAAGHACNGEGHTRPCPLYFARTSYVENIWTIGLPAT